MDKTTYWIEPMHEAKKILGFSLTFNNGDEEVWTYPEQEILIKAAREAMREINAIRHG